MQDRPTHKIEVKPSYQEQRKLEVYKIFKSLPNSLSADVIKLINRYDCIEKNDAIKNRLFDYISNLKDKPERNTFFCIPYGFTKTLRVHAAKTLSNYIDNPSADNRSLVLDSLPQLTSGDLNAIWKEYGKANPYHYGEIIELAKKKEEPESDRGYYKGDTDDERMRGRLSKD